MQAQSVTLDFLKPVGTVVDLSDKFNARVGDSMTPFNLFVTEGRKPKALNGLHPELEAAVGDGELKDGKVVMSDNANGIHWVGNAKNVTGYNRLTLTFPAEVFPQSGFCYGHLILANDAGVRESSVDIWFKVLDGLEIMGLAADYYDSAIELELKKLKEANSQAAQRLSEMKATPEGFANLDALEAKYPNGNSNLNVTVDDGHLWIWLNGGWRDCGQYQTPALDSEVLDKIESLLYKQQQELDEHESDLKLDRTDIQDVRGVGSLKDIELVDENGNRIVDDSGVGISGQRWLINTDKTLSQADLPADAKAVGEALITKPDAYDIPVLYLYGDGIPSLQSKADSLSDGISYSFPRFNISGSLKKIKVQGASSATLAKKNYTLQFDHSVEIFPEYGKQKKYVIKADMTDPSHVRNTGCAELWGKVRQTRVKADDAIKLNDTDYLVDNNGNHIVGETDPQLSIGGTFGAVDGFPIAVYINDQYWGLYNFNVPKDSWMAKMPAHDKNAAIVSAFWTSFGAEDVKLDGNDMEIEFCGSKDTTWVSQSINALIDALKASYTTRDDFTQAVAMRLDIDSAIDYYIFSAAVGNTDGVLRNFLLQTWDRRKWYFAAYDLDMTFGRTPDSPGWLSPVYDGNNNRRGGTTILNLADGNRLFHQLWKFYKDDIVARYKELAKGPLSTGEALTLLTNYSAPIPNALLAQEDRTWPQTSLSGTSNLNQIRWWYTEHINLLNNQVNQVANV